ncbi:MAG: HD domain-containing protein [Paludisphaera borealis]|uniref:HD domain-containing protein n=1 Tax=Paludisphaera borealis TaxID=1387353 RepID=UPI0028458B1F|nr:HD domain-containing protein [Paludisphaera borealis]MDR3620137.1 HD domain-containing protein [Paludisphaera borealis]
MSDLSLSSSPGAPLFSLRFEDALRFAATSHEGQTRRASETPYVQHVVAVAWILGRSGFGEDVVIAGLLHDVVEDTAVTVEEVAARFGPVVADLVERCSEIKNDATGRMRPWIDRKRDHLAALADAPVEARAVILADKIHNLTSIEYDLSLGREVWSAFHADRAEVLWYYQAILDCCGRDDPRLERLSACCREILGRVSL